VKTGSPFFIPKQGGKCMPDEVKDEKKVGQEGDATPVKDSTVTDPYKEVFGDDAGNKQSVIEEPTDQRDRSMLGRRVKRNEDIVNTLVSKIDTLVERLGSSQGQTQNYNTYEDQEDEEFFRKADRYEKIKSDRHAKYESAYLTKIRQLGMGDPDGREIFAEMQERFNVVRSSNPELDAETNWAKAEASLLRKKFSPNKPNVRSERNTASTDLGVNATNDSTASQEVQLDPFAQEYVARTGMKKEKIESALKK